MLIDGVLGAAGGRILNKVFGNGKVHYGDGSAIDLATQGFMPGVKDYAGAAIGHLTRAGGEAAPLDKALEDMFHELDQGSITPQQFNAWAEKHSAALQAHQAGLYAQDRDYGRTAGMGGYQPILRRIGILGPAATQEEDKQAAQANSLASPRNKALLQEYYRTRDPALKEQLLDNLKQNPTQTRAQQEKQDLAESPLGKGVDDILRTPGGKPILSAQNVIASGDPVNVIATAAIPFTAGLSGAGLGTRVAIAAGTGAGINTAQYLREHPNASAGGTLQAAGEGGLVGGATGLAGEAITKAGPPAIRAISNAGGKMIDASGRVLDAAGKDIHQTVAQILDSITNPYGPPVPATVEGTVPVPRQTPAAPATADPPKALQATGSGGMDRNTQPVVPPSKEGVEATEKVPEGSLAETYPGDFPEHGPAESSADFPEDVEVKRVKLRKEVIEKIVENQPRGPNGEMVDPFDSKPLVPGQIDKGHKPGQEWRTRRQMHKNLKSSRQKQIEMENNPDLYHLEHRSSNRSHQHEQK